MPDSYSKFSKYLGKKGQLYEMTKTGNTLTDVYEYEEYEDNENILKYKKKI